MIHEMQFSYSETDLIRMNNGLTKGFGVTTTNNQGQESFRDMNDTSFYVHGLIRKWHGLVHNDTFQGILVLRINSGLLRHK